MVLVAGLTAVDSAVLAVSRSHPGLYRALLPVGTKIDSGEAWRCLTSLVAHHGVTHLAINTGLTILVTPLALRRLRWSQFAVIYVGGGFAANAVRYAAGGRHGGGASAAVVAVASAAGVLELRRRDVPALAVTGPVVIAVPLGVAAAHQFSDNHLLAASIGGAVGAVSSQGVSVAVATIAVVAVSTVAMLVRMLVVR